MSQPSKSVTSRWSHEETLLLLELLLQARRDQQLNNDKLSVVRDVLKGFIPTFSDEYPSRQWTLRILENRVSFLKNIWRAFRAAETRSGTTYHEETGMLDLSKQNAEFIVSVYKRYGKYVVTKPLPINDNISPCEWGEIFRQDLPAMKNAIAANDDEGFERAAAAEEEDTEEEEGRSTQMDQEGQEEVGGGTQDNNAGDESPDEDVSDEDLLNLLPSPTNSGTSTPAPSSIARPAARSSAARSSAARGSAARSSRNTPATPTPPNGQPNRLPRSLQQKRIAAQSSELSQVMSNVFGPGIGGTKEHKITARSPGADDLEQASKDCQSLFEEFGVRNMLKIIMWLKEDPMNPPIWNSLSSKEAKTMMIEDISGVEFSRY
ncbi:hypothetical protein E4U22_002669 [Claviceps purpurea]|nr:hypothetical protein E4U22_002669 [Claviceps purpurea]